jgi:3-phenylpropionate/trans-cinnamate dioxygenase ferredoxin component
VNSATSPNRVRACAVADLEVGSVLRIEVSGRPICLVRCDDGFHAVSDICSHEDYSLSEGEVDAAQCEIECWKHGSLFSLTTGEPLTLPATLPIEVYRIEVLGDEVFLVMP